MSESPKKKEKKASKPVKYCKAPQAPKRFKSAFIFFTMERHKAIREKLEENRGRGDNTPDVAKLVSEEWRNLGREERAVWDEKARLDKERYEVEKSMYTGPWKIPTKAKRKSHKDPNAPKRPMSSFLSFSNSRRGALKRGNPGLNNAEASKLLADMWRSAPDEEKREHIEKEERLRGIYKVEIAAWRERTKREEDDQRERREEVAKSIVANRAEGEKILEAQGEQYLGIGGLPLHPPPYHPSQRPPMPYGHFPPPYGPPHMYPSYPPMHPRARQEGDEKLPQMAPPLPPGYFPGPMGGGGYYQPPPHPSYYPGPGGQQGEQGIHPDQRSSRVLPGGQPESSEQGFYYNQRQEPAPPRASYLGAVADAAEMMVANDRKDAAASGRQQQEISQGPPVAGDSSNDGDA